MHNHLIKDDYFNLLPVLSHSCAIWYFINTVRNIGKTWSLKKYCWLRAVKSGKKCIIVRRFTKEAKECAETFYASADIIKFCNGMKPYDPETGRGNMKQRGRTFYHKYKGKWRWFVKIMSLSEFKNKRSADDVDCDTIFFDEYTTTARQYRQYFGNEVEDFIDLTISICRQHPIRVIFCGNNECIFNPYFEYLKIIPPPTNFEGIRFYKQKTVAFYQRTTPCKDTKESKYLNKVSKLLKNTRYGAYLDNGAYKQGTGLKWATAPKLARLYVNLKWKDKPIRILTYNEVYYIDNKIDLSEYVLVDYITPDIPHPIQLYKSRDRKAFLPLIQAISNNNVKYANESVYNAIQPFYKWLGISN